MRPFPLFFLTILSVVDIVAADEPSTSTAKAHMRCSAINYLVNSAPKAYEISPHQNFKLYMELHAKWAWIPYGGDYPKYKADYDSTMQTLQAELRTKRLSGGAFAEEFKNCISLQRQTMDAFMACLRSTDTTDESTVGCGEERTASIARRF